MKNVRKISKKYYLRQIVACFLVCYMLFGIPVQIARATPYDGQFVNGQGSIVQSGNTTNITCSDGSIINWGGFDIASSEIAQFFQPGVSAAVLNRILSGNATMINGSLLANGRVFVVNPAGVIFGTGATVNVAQLVASSLNISNPDFINGRYNFAGGNGAVINRGDIIANSVALIGKHVLNTGAIRCPGGYVVMAAGDRILLGRQGSDIVVEVDAVTVPENPPMEGMGDVINEGTIEAAGGTIVLAAGDTFSRAIEGLDGLSVAVEGGTGRVGQFGTLNADGIEGDGGSVTLTAADEVVLGSDSVTTANAGTNGDGGDVIAYSPDTALFRDGALIEARGGSQSGDGGFVEVSGKEYIDVQGSVDTRAPHGDTGTFLIDPHNVTITAIGDDDIDASEIRAGWLQDQLGTTNVDVRTDSRDVTGELGWIVVQDPIEWNSAYSLGLYADAYIRALGNITNDGTGNLTLTAALQTVEVFADLTIGGNLDIFAAGNLIINANADCGGSMLLDSGLRVELFPLDILHPVELVSGGDTDILANTTITLGGDVVAGKNGAGSLTLTSNRLGGDGSSNYTTAFGDFIAADNVTINGNLELVGGNYGVGHADQIAMATNGMLMADGWVRKKTPGELFLFGGSSDLAVDLRHTSSGYADPAASTCSGNLWIIGEGDVQIAGDVTTLGEYYEGPEYGVCRTTGGVAIVSNEGRVYTQVGDTLNVSITGTSDHFAQAGVYDPELIEFDTEGKPIFYTGKDRISRAAIIVQSSDTLKIGENAMLIAQGQYYEGEIPDFGVVDDREAIDFLDIPATIGGYERDEGEPFDLAIYMASTAGDVQIDGEVMVLPCYMYRGEYPEVPTTTGATVVADAYYNVEFLDSFLSSLGGPEWLPFRMEVCSRITEWLSQAIANIRLPYAANPQFMEDLLGDDYLLRGAGLGNPGIDDGRAWVLENPTLQPPAAPLYTPASEEELEGCGTEIAVVVNLLGVTEEALRASFAAAPGSADRELCDTCARFLANETVLDIGGTQLAALGQVISEFVTTPAPPSEEQMALIAATMSSHAGDDTHYATAGQYLDALAEYVGILNTEIGLSADEAAAFAATRVTPIENASLAAYVQARLAALGG